ncbi:MAG: DNA mismatch repair protein MutS [Bacteroidia bacterium]|nr:DNA mismatch repair protein MutS [Bacteroidia bacterium]
MKNRPAKASTKSEVETPLMKQYYSIKAKYPDALLLFRVGDFYETFGEDAVRAAGILGIVLTRRANGAAQFVELAGFPHHSLDTYLPKLVRAGQRVAICDQLEDPKMTKTIVKRGVTELVTPGVSYNDKTLDHRANNFLAAVHLGDELCGVAFLDVSTGEFLCAQGNAEYVDKLLQGFRPSEILFHKQRKKEFTEHFGDRFYTFGMEDWTFTYEFGYEKLTRHFNTPTLKGFGIDELGAGIIAAGAALHYLADTAHDRVQHISSISRIEEEKYVWLDRFTIRNLELFNPVNEKAKTLLEVLDLTSSPMGSRMLRRWVALPLKDLAPIQERLDVVDHFLERPELISSLTTLIGGMGDLERMISKVSTGRISPKELMTLKRSLLSIAPLKESFLASGNVALQKLGEQLNPCKSVTDKLEIELNPDPPFLVNKGNVINKGVNSELDELRSIAYSGKDHLLKIQQRESERTGIPSLKIAYNSVFGYYLEVTNAHKEKVPADWHRKQTLTNAERYITPELKEYEEKILGAEEKILALEAKLFTELVLWITDYIQPVQLNAQLIAKADCLLSFALVAHRNNYVRPQLDESKALEIKDGRHPVIEQLMVPGEEYVANDIYLDDSVQQIIMITGPNMSGKSALLRQTALIVLMAQVGCFVPARAARIGLVDKIFTRVGASDNISSGESTFMVEMNETASILNNLSSRSLILLDEIGRGTSTYDGISIAWAIAEFIHEHPQHKAKTLFATHYHELNDMAEQFPRIRNYNVSVKEAGKKIIFLRKLVPGGTEHSFGIHVARMAGMPKLLLDRAEQILKQLESTHAGSGGGKGAVSLRDNEMQLSFFKLDDPVLENVRKEILDIDVNNLTPVEALNKLNEIKKILKG